MYIPCGEGETLPLATISVPGCAVALNRSFQFITTDMVGTAFKSLMIVPE